VAAGIDTIRSRGYDSGMVERVISGGQTGADQAGLAVAMRLGIPTSGCMPKGWLTEDGPRPDLAVAYGLEEADTAAYPKRTERNVLASDGTVVFGDARSRGSMLTARLCRRHGRPCCMISLDDSLARAAARLRAWLDEHRVGTQRRRQPRQPGAGHLGVRGGGPGAGTRGHRRSAPKMTRP
jgi:Circularly permutated YpsA SLOG family